MMRYQDQLVKHTQKALMDVVRAAEHVPEDKVGWAPADGARSTLAQMQEIAIAAAMFVPLIENRGMPAEQAHAEVSSRRASSSYDSLAQCISAAKEGTQKVCGLIAAFPDAELDKEVHLPFGPGMTVTMADVLGLHAWNLVYHLGQINYIQTCLGDHQMH